jgi:hypothetical protein
MFSDYFHGFHDQHETLAGKWLEKQGFRGMGHRQRLAFTTVGTLFCEKTRTSAHRVALCAVTPEGHLRRIKDWDQLPPGVQSKARVRIHERNQVEF